MKSGCALEEFLIIAISRILDHPSIKHVAVGASSPIPAGAALLRKKMAKEKALRVSIIHGNANNPFTDGGRELFDVAGQGRIDTFFLGGAQIDSKANINLVGVGGYPNSQKRFPGSFGSAFMYFMIPNIILFRLQHTRQIFVEKVDFISAPGVSEIDVNRRGGPKWLVTNLCVMSFDREVGRFRLELIHPGHSVSEVIDNTGFDFDISEDMGVSPSPSLFELSVLREEIAPELAKTYPKFVDMLFSNRKE